MHRRTMTRINAICPISMRPAFFGSRRIAPVATSSRLQHGGAGLTAEHLRPEKTAHEATQSNHEVPQPIHAAAFVTQVIGQFQTRPPNFANITSMSYEAASTIGRYRGPWLSVTA